MAVKDNDSIKHNSRLKYHLLCSSAYTHSMKTAHNVVKGLNGQIKTFFKTVANKVKWTERITDVNVYRALVKE